MTEEQQIYGGQTAEEAIMKWWAERFDTPVPEDVKSWLRMLVRNEVARTRLAEHRLDDTTLQRIYDSRRLCQTKLDNVIESINRVRRQKERLRQFVVLNTELSEQKLLLYRLNKERAAIGNDRQQLERYEEFEAVNGRMQRLHTLNVTIAENRQRLKNIMLVIDQAKKLAEEAERRLVLEAKKKEENEQAVITAAEVMAEIEKLEATANCCQQSFDASDAELKILNERINVLRNVLSENDAAAELLQNEITGLNLKLQTLEVHQSMLIRSDSILVLLDELQTVANKKELATQNLNKALKQQEEYNNALGKLFAEYQELNAKIEAKGEEVEGHRRSIAGQDSYLLQRQALEQRGRKLMLETGLTLWRNIATGYDMIEKKQQIITELRLHANHLNHDIDVLEEKVRLTDKQLEIKSYHLTLSKSQNVIELRGDLSEGMPCPVCGATNHPWQGESITEQNALIASLKSDYETMKRDQQKQAQTLKEMQADLIETKARLESENAHLAVLLERQQKDTGEWKYFSQLDPSFNDCSQSTNREARLTLLGLLIEKATVDSENAEKVLNNFTFHLDAISRLGEEVQKLRDAASELTTKLNEANTACQVIAGQVERFNNGLERVTQEYSRRYEVLEHSITIPAWFQSWKETPESLKLRIQEMRENYDRIGQQLQDKESKLSTLRAKNELLQTSLQQGILDATECESYQKAMAERKEKAMDAIVKLLPGTDKKSYFTITKQENAEQEALLVAAQKAFDERRQTLLTAQAEYKNLEDNIHKIEELTSEERRELDLWMQRYNMSHPPVQMAELEKVLVDGKEWGELRNKVRNLEIDYSTTTNRIDYLRSQIIALQAEGLRPIEDNGDSEQILLQEQLQELELQQRNIQKQMAQYDLQLLLHEQSVAKATKKV